MIQIRTVPKWLKPLKIKLWTIIFCFLILIICVVFFSGITVIKTTPTPEYYSLSKENLKYLEKLAIEKHDLSAAQRIVKFYTYSQENPVELEKWNNLLDAYQKNDFSGSIRTSKENNANQINVDALVELRKKIKSSLNDVSDLTAEGALFDSKNFRELYYSGEKDKNKTVLLFLDDPTADAQEKRIAILILQKEPWDDYLLFLTHLYQLEKKKKGDMSLFEGALFPGWEWNKGLLKNFDTPSTRSFLVQVRNEKLVSKNILQAIDMLLSGEYMKQLAKRW